MKPLYKLNQPSQLGPLARAGPEAAVENCHRRMLDAASYGAHCVLLSPAPGAGVAARPGPPTRRPWLAALPDPYSGFSLVDGSSETAWASGPPPRPGPEVAVENCHRRMFCDSEASSSVAFKFLRLKSLRTVTAVATAAPAVL